MITCPCGIECESGEYYDNPLFDELENIIGWICIHGFAFYYL